MIRLTRKVRERLGLPRSVMGMNARNLNCIYPYNERQYFPNVDNKLRCKGLLQSHGIPVPETYLRIDSSGGIRRWRDSVEHVEAFVLKPNRSYGGQGIRLFQRIDGTWADSNGACMNGDVEFHIMQICSGAYSLDNIADTAFLEQMVVNHPGLDLFQSPEVSGIADIRVIYRGDSALMAMLRVPTASSGGRANLHQGGLGIGIDVESGTSLDGCQGNDVIDRHPETGRKLRGFPIPHWDDVLRYGACVSEAVGLGYVGVDFVIDRDGGVMVLEVNARPGLNIQIANQAGLWGVFK